MKLAGLRTDIVGAVEIVPPRWMDDDALVALAQRYEPLSFGRFADGTLLVTPLAEFRSGIRSATLTARIANWAEAGDRGFVAANGGFNLPDGSLFTPNVTFVARGRPITPESEREFPVLVPDAVFELESKSDRIQTTMKKIRAYPRNGVGLVVLIEPHPRRVYVGHVGDEEPRDLGVVDRLDCSPAMPEFVLDVAAVLNVR
jgi:Uma2 family endonuclease